MRRSNHAIATILEHPGLSFADTKRTQFDVQMLIAGDLTGAPQPA